MNIISIYKNHFTNIQKYNNDFELIRINDRILIGEDKNGNAVFVISSNESNRDGVAQKTKKLSFECNINISYIEEETTFHDCFHIIKCYSKDEKEIVLFFKLCESLFLGSNNNTVDYIVEVFSILNDFFTEKSKISKESAQGLYAELYTIYYFREMFDFAKCWQKKDKMKFDFSITDLIKLEVKSTIKEERIHRFKHDQILNSNLEIFVLSYKFLEDNDGLSLKTLIENSIPLMKNYPKKQARLIHILYSEENMDVLNDIKFSEVHIINNMKFFNSKMIPKFEVETPANVSHAEYDSNCELIENIESDYVINYFKNKQKSNM